MIYNSRKHSYRELPMRFAELGTVYRYERSGVLHGMERVRGFTQDDSHVFCTPRPARDEVIGDPRPDGLLLQTFGYDTAATWRPVPRTSTSAPTRSGRSRPTRCAGARARGCPTKSTRAAARSTRPRST
jgi:threonyl-tRNA synthetase